MPGGEPFTLQTKRPSRISGHQRDARRACRTGGSRT
jgi:hypothetical protein